MMRKDKSNFLVGFALGALLCGTAAVYAGVYTPKSSGAWIRDALLYSDVTDQINVLGDIQPGTGILMQEIGLRFNSLNTAGKKQNWAFASYQLDELSKALTKIGVTRPARKPLLDAFIADSLPAVTDAIAAQDKAAFKTAMTNLATDCTTCHTTSGENFPPVKAGKSAMPM
jgi:cytochrome c556